MPSRILRDWTDSLALAELSPEAERFFVRLIMKADDYGRFHGDERLLKSALFPLLADARLSAVRSWRDECAAARLLAPYQDERGRVFLEIVNFGQQRRAKSKFPEPAGNALASASDCPQPASNCALYSDSESDSDFGVDDSSELGEPASEPFVSIPLIRKDGEYVVTVAEVEQLQGMFPAVDVKQEVRGCAAWNLANPAKRKTKAGIRKHVTAWIARVQDKGGTPYFRAATPPAIAGGANGPKPIPEPSCNWRRIATDSGEWPGKDFAGLSWGGLYDYVQAEIVKICEIEKGHN